jgi:CubicO group peptidase (beta-lactamase class C family)
LKEFVARAVKTPLLFKPGTEYKYQSMGFLLAAEVAQRITNQPFAAFLAKEVYEPLGMTRSTLDLWPFNLSETVRSQTEFAAPESGLDQRKRNIGIGIVLIGEILEHRGVVHIRPLKTSLAFFEVFSIPMARC